MHQIISKRRKIIGILIRTLWIPVILFCSHLLISIRSKTMFLEKLHLYILLSLALYFIVLMVGRISMKLEDNAFTEDNYTNRVFKQLLYGFLSPLVFIIILVGIYNEFIDNSIVQTAHLAKEVPIIIMFLYVANGFYLVIHIERQFSTSSKPVEEITYNDKVLVYHKGAYVPVNLMEIALIYQRNQINWLVTFNEEEHILDLCLKEIAEILSAKQFFKINRSQIVNKEIISKFKSGSFGKIELLLKINATTATVSKDRAKDFRKWFYN